MFTDIKRNELLLDLLYMLWTDSNFEKRFRAEWRAVYILLQDKEFDQISTNILKMIKIWNENNYV